MRAVSAARQSASNGSEEQPCKFGTIVQTLWPTKPALNLAQRMGCTERNASYFITGRNRPTLDAILAIVNEIK